MREGTLDLEKKVLVENLDSQIRNFNLPENFIQITIKYLFHFLQETRENWIA